MTSEKRLDTFAEYRAEPGLNLSRLKRMSTSAKLYNGSQDRTDTKALSLGRAIHMAVLEPDAFLHEVAVYPGKVRRGKEWDAFQAENVHKQIITKSDMHVCESVAAAVSAHRVAAEYFSEGTPEVSVYWNHMGFAMKSRVDWLRDDMIVDLKSARDITPGGFARAAASMQYHAQMAFYHDAAKSLDGKDRKVVLLAVEKEYPFDVAPYVLPIEALNAGRKMYEGWILRVLACVKTGHWPGVAEEETELHLPGWCFSDMDDATLIIDGLEVAV